MIIDIRSQTQFNEAISGSIDCPHCSSQSWPSSYSCPTCMDKGISWDAGVPSEEFDAPQDVKSILFRVYAPSEDVLLGLSADVAGAQHNNTNVRACERLHKALTILSWALGDADIVDSMSVTTGLVSRNGGIVVCSYFSSDELLYTNPGALETSPPLPGEFKFYVKIERDQRRAELVEYWTEEFLMDATWSEVDQPPRYFWPPSDEYAIVSAHITDWCESMKT